MPLIKKYISTCSPSSMKGKYRPIEVKLPVFRAFELLCDVLEKMNCNNIIKNEKFFDVFCVNGPYEYSFALTYSNDVTLIEMNVFNNDFLRSSKKEFADLYKRISEDFGPYLFNKNR